MTRRTGTPRKMRKARYDGLKAILIQKQRELKARVNADNIKAREHGDQRIHDEDLASELSQRDIASNLSEQHHQELIAINTAIGNLLQGTYGYCTECKEEIPERRLAAIPYALRCRNCEEKRESTQQTHRTTPYSSIHLDSPDRVAI